MKLWQIWFKQAITVAFLDHDAIHLRQSSSITSKTLDGTIRWSQPLINYCQLVWRCVLLAIWNKRVLIYSLVIFGFECSAVFGMAWLPCYIVIASISSRSSRIGISAHFIYIIHIIVITAITTLQSNTDSQLVAVSRSGHFLCVCVWTSPVHDLIHCDQGISLRWI